MGALTLTTFRANLRKDLVDGGTYYTDNEIDRAVTKAYADLNRFLPRELYYETTLRFTVTAEAWTSTTHGTYVQLTYKPIKDLSEVVTNAAGTTTYTRDTDYTMDYVNGKITTISGGSMANTTAYKISYTRSKIAVDLSSLTALIRILAVEYPANQVPIAGVSAELFADLLWIQCGEDTQAETSQYKHLLVKYLATHTVPTADAAGTCPTFLEETVSLAASAYLMFTKAAYYEQLVATALASAGTEFGLTTTVHSLAQIALSAIKTNHDLAVVALAAGNAITDAISFATAVTELELANTALDNLTTPLAAVSTALAKVDTYLAGGSESVKALLAQIATDAAILRTAVSTAVSAANGELDTISLSDYTAIDAVWPEEVKHILTAAVPNMQDLLEAGDDFIDAVNTGEGVAAEYRQYAEVVATMQRAWAQKRTDLIQKSMLRVQQANAYCAEASQRLDDLRTYLEQARGYSTISDGFIAEANQWVGKCQAYISEASQRIATASGYVSVEGMKLYQVDRYLEEATRYINIAGGYANEAMYRIAQIDRYLEEANGYIAQGDRYMTLADRFRTDGTERRNEAWAIWQDRKQLSGKLADVSNRQVVR